MAAKLTENQKRLQRGSAILNILEKGTKPHSDEPLTALDIMRYREILKYTLPTYKAVEHSGLLSMQITKIQEEIIDPQG